MPAKGSSRLVIKYSYYSQVQQSKLWQGPYEVVQQVNKVNKVNYCIRQMEETQNFSHQSGMQLVNLMEEQEMHDEGEIPVWEADTRSTVQQLSQVWKLTPAKRKRGAAEALTRILGYLL